MSKVSGDADLDVLEALLTASSPRFWSVVSEEVTHAIYTRVTYI